MAVNQIICNVGGGNTGIPDCAFTMANVLKVFLVPNNFVLTAEQLASKELTLAALQAAASADLPSARIYPTPEIVGVTNNSEDVVTQTLGYGVPVVVRDGMYNIQFQYTDGGNCLSNALRKFNKTNRRVLFIDANGVLVGTKVGETIMGIPLQVFYARPFGFNDGANVANFSFQLTFSPNYINEDIGFIQLGLGDVMAIAGLQNINLKFVSRTAGVIVVQAVTGCSKENLFEEFGTELADVANFVAKNLNGNIITITSVAEAANSSGFTVTLDTTYTDYSTGQLLLNLAAPSVLAGNDVPGYEGVQLTVPAA